MRLAASGLPFLARTLLYKGEDFAELALIDPETGIDGMMNSGSAELFLDPRRGDLLWVADEGVRGEFGSGFNVCRDALVLCRGLAPAVTGLTGSGSAGSSIFTS